MNRKNFDLNIEKILENWDVRHAVREVIANALDEQLLTGTSPVQIEKRGAIWFIRDHGRGIKYTHLTQNENQEKLDSPNVIGRFGIGLKDALATFERHGVEVQIRSKFGTIQTTKMVKHGFGDIVTLHAIIEDPLDTEFVGTEFEMRGVDDDEMEAAKQLFLIFSRERVLDTTRYGQVIGRHSGPGAIYINGVKVAEEVNFLFSYNVTLLNAAIKKAINRERSHVGRTAYADSIKKILLATSNPLVAEQLSKDLALFHEGTMHDELAWIDVQEHAVKILNTQGNIMMVTAEEAMNHPDMMDQARNSGLTIMTIPENLRAKIADGIDLEGNPIVDFTQFTQTYNDSFVFSFVDRTELSSSERSVLDAMPWIIKIFGGQPSNVRAILISNTMRPDLFVGTQALGCWDPNTESIVIWREQLKSFSAYAGTLIHELVHAETGHQDVTRDFESSLTRLIGNLCEDWHAMIQGHELNESLQISPEALEVLEAQSVVADACSLIGKHAHEQIGELRIEKTLTEKRLSDANRTLDRLRVPLTDAQSTLVRLRGRLTDAYSAIDRLRESEQKEKMRAHHLAAALKETQEIVNNLSSSSSMRTRKAWYRFW